MKSRSKTVPIRVVRGSTGNGTKGSQKDFVQRFNSVVLGEHLRFHAKIRSELRPLGGSVPDRVGHSAGRTFAMDARFPATTFCTIEGAAVAVTQAGRDKF